MTTTAMTLGAPGSLAKDLLAQHSRRAAGLAVDKILGDEASPELKKAAADLVAPWAEKLVRGLDDFIRIPGTNIRVGLDSIVGFIIPGAGDAITGTASMALLLLALKERVPTVAIGKMVLNILVDTVGGLLPVVGDAFDVAWRSNRRNLDIIEQYKADPQKEPTALDYLLVGSGLALAVLSVLLPIFIVYGVGLGAVLGLGHLFG
ncbi:MAG: DUF4112 domain-containing protein [Sandaracinaceae bacterium]|nr:DUF4112 domain-containing protein [Sandaracinaceae bacterium]